MCASQGSLLCHPGRVVPAVGFAAGSVCAIPPGSDPTFVSLAKRVLAGNRQQCLKCGDLGEPFTVPRRAVKARALVLRGTAAEHSEH